MTGVQTCALPIWADGLFPGWKAQVTNAQELHKFLYQNGQRAWQAAGGTGTDAQLEATSKAQPNDTMFPAALRNTAAWVKAGELAGQAKANAMDQWLAEKGNSPQSQQQFEAAWRNSFRPNDYIKQTMPPVNDQGWILRQDPEGRLAYVSPDRKNAKGIW